MKKYYVKAGKLFDDSRVFWPFLGYKARPEWIYTPRTGSGN